MHDNLSARAITTIDAPGYDVWHALVSPAAIKQYMFGADVKSDWREGTPITWEGEWEGKKYKDSGMILKVEPERLLRYTHYSPRSGKPDTPENRHTITIQMETVDHHTTVTLSQDGNQSEEERSHSQSNWESMLAALKKYVEQNVHAVRT